MSAEQVDVPLCPESEPPRPSLVGPLVAASDCDGCPLAEARYLDDGTPQVCCCGRVYADEDFTWPAERPSCVVDLPPLPVRELAQVVEDLAEVRRWKRDELARVAAGGPAPPSCPIARLMAASDGASFDATPAQVERMRRYLIESETNAAKEVRRGFVNALVARMERSMPRDEPTTDAARARANAARLDALPLEHVQVLLAVTRADAGGWESAVRVVVEEVLPRPVVSAFRAPGRPRVDRATVPPEVQREAEAEARLAEAVRAWVEGSGR